MKLKLHSLLRLCDFRFREIPFPRLIWIGLDKFHLCVFGFNSSVSEMLLLMIIAYLHLINLSNKLNISWEDVLIQFVFINSFSLIRRNAKIIIINKNLIESRCLNGMKCSIIKIFYQRSKWFYPIPHQYAASHLKLQKKNSIYCQSLINV